MEDKGRRCLKGHDVMIQKPDAAIRLVNMEMAAHPLSVLKTGFYRVQPCFHGLVDRSLVNAFKQGFFWLDTQGTGMS